MPAAVRNLLGSTALHVGVATGLGVWVGSVAGAAPRPDVRFGIAEQPVVVRFVEDTVPDRETRVATEVAVVEEPVLEPPAVPPDPRAFEPAPTDPEPRIADARFLVDPRIVVRPRHVEPVEVAVEPAPAPAAFVEAELRDDDNAPPAYPRASVARGEEGEVWLRLSIDRTGVVSEVELERGCGHPRLHRAAIAAASKWRFSPALRDGVPVASDKIVPILFQIADDVSR